MPEETEKLYYIRHKGFCGNSWFWWKPRGHGYTCNLDEALKGMLQAWKKYEYSLSKVQDWPKS